MISQTISHYRIVKKLGAGGMGVVYLAEDTSLGRKVAIKFLPSESAADEQAKKRLIREAQSAAALDHPNICAIHEVAEEDGQSFIVMQYVEGETLATLIQRQPLELREVLDIAVQIADALAEAHSRGMIHRDIKPQNIMLTARRQVKVMDFGLAKAVKDRSALETEAETQSLLSEPGAIVGTVPYMSPEQVRGESLDVRSDLFSFGSVLYETISGHQPFGAENAAATLSAILTREPPLLARYSREIPQELERIVTKALRKDREERYQTAKDLLIDLKSLRHHLELEAELERSKEPVSVATTGGQAIGETTNQQAASTQEALGPATSSIEHVISRVRRHKLRFAGLALALLGLAGIGVYLLASGGATIDSVAILPFVNVSADPNMEYLSDGITESLISNLSQLPGLKVMSRNSAFRYKGRDVDPQAVGRELKVRAVLTGRLVQRGDGLAISLELVDTRDNRQLWGEQYNRKLSDILAVQAEISREVSDKLRLRLTGAEQKQLAKHYTENTEAYRLLLKGRYFSNKRTEEGLRKGIDYFNQAIALDANYALAYTELANGYGLLANFYALPAKEAFSKAKAAALKAVELDDTLAEAHASLAGIKFFYDWDWAGSEREARRAIDLNSNLPTIGYAQYLAAMGRFDEALEIAKRAQELDPLSVVINSNVGRIFYLKRQYEEAIDQYGRTIEMEPNHFLSRRRRGMAYLQKKLYEDAIAEVQRSRVLSGDTTEEIGYVGYAYAVSGKRSEALGIINELTEQSKRRYVSPYVMALIYTGLGDKDHAFEWLDKAYEARDNSLIYLKVEPSLDPLRSDPRFADLLRRMNLAP